MAGTKRHIGVDIGRDFITVDIDVEMRPKVKFSVDEASGEIKPTLIDKGKYSNSKQLKIILNPSGLPVYPQNHYLHHLAADNMLKNVNTPAQALLAFSRWMHATATDYNDLTANPEEGAP